MILNEQGKEEFLRENFHPYFDITLSANIEEKKVEQFVNYVLPISEIDKQYSITEDMRVFFNDDFNNVIFTSTDEQHIYQYECYQNVYFIRLKPFEKTIRMHILPKRYDASNAKTETSLLFFKDNKQSIDDNNFSCTPEYKRLSNKNNINLHYKKNLQMTSHGIYKFDIKEQAKNFRNLQINMGYSYNNSNPTNPMKLKHYTGILDESDEDGIRIENNEDFTEFNQSLMDVNCDNSIPKEPELSDEEYTLFRGDCWVINNNFEASAAITSTAKDNFTVTGTFRTKNDLVGIIWNSKDIINHPYISYGERTDYNGVILEFDYEMSGCMDFSNADISITINTTDNKTYYLTMNRFIHENNHVKIDFDSLTLLPYNMYIDNGQSITVQEVTNLVARHIKSIMFVIVPTNFVNGGNTYEIMNNVDFTCSISNITVTRGKIKNEYKDIPPHQYRLCEGYDDFYHLNPFRICREMKKLGYTNWVDLYIGASHYYEKQQSNPRQSTIDTSDFNHTRTETMVASTSTNSLLNKAFRAWLQCYARELKKNNVNNLIISVSMENLQCPTRWRQADMNGYPAITGWVPSTFFYDPSNPEVIAYMKKVSEECLDIVVENGMQPILQMGEAWWWWNENDRPKQPPCFYNPLTRVKYRNDTGEEMPLYDTSWVEEYDETLADWLNEQLCNYSDELRSVVKSSKYENGLYMALFFPPSVTDTDRVPSLMTHVNYLKNAYSPSKLDILQIEDYDWVIEDSPHHPEAYTIGEELGFTKDKLHYYGGFVQYEEDANEYWPLIIKSMNDALEQQFAEVYVWAGPQIRRDNIVFGNDYTNITQQQELINHTIQWPTQTIPYSDGEPNHWGGFSNPHSINTLYHKTIKYFNGDIYTEENNKYLIQLWTEKRSNNG